MTDFTYEFKDPIKILRYDPIRFKEAIESAMDNTTFITREEWFGTGHAAVFKASKREGAKPTPPFSEASQKPEVAENDR